jgi:BlaI family transcriptional regulator, penicillinase repressor
MTSNVTAGHAKLDDIALAHDPAELGELERSILQLLWQNGTLSAERVREELDQLDRPLKDSTIRTVLRRLEEKGYVTHTLDSRTFLYSPSEAAPIVAGRAVKRILDWFCEGSVEALLVGMVDSAVLDRKELQRLADRIASARSEQKPAHAPVSQSGKLSAKGVK